MLKTVEGTFAKGKVDLNEVPAGVEQAKVLVTFLPADDQPRQGRMIRWGQFSGPPEQMSTEADFKLAEWQGEEEFDEQ